MNAATWGHRAIAATLVMTTVIFGFGPGLGSAAVTVGLAYPEQDELSVQQAGVITRVTWQSMEANGATKIGFRVRTVDGGFSGAGTRERAQVKFMLRPDIRYNIEFRAFYPNRGWSDWSPPFQIESGRITNAPSSVQLVAADGVLRAAWGSTGADRYEFRVQRDGQQPETHSVSRPTAIVPDLINGQTYQLSLRAIYPDGRSPWTPWISATPNSSQPVEVALRDYVIDVPQGPQTMPINTAVFGADHRVASMAVEVSGSEEDTRTVDATYVPTASATAGVDGAWVSDPLVIEVIDYQLVTHVYDAGGNVLASSIQTWILGDLDADHVRQPSRVPTFR